jgi:hypothetical protein
MLPVVVATAAPSAGRTAVNRGLTPNSRFFPFYFDGSAAAEGDGHGEASISVRI